MLLRHPGQSVRAQTRSWPSRPSPPLKLKCLKAAADPLAGTRFLAGQAVVLIVRRGFLMLMQQRTLALPDPGSARRWSIDALLTGSVGSFSWLAGATSAYCCCGGLGLPD
jgi:hypothetical protein